MKTEMIELLNAGWKITHEGPSGTQLEAPKKMRLLDKVCLVAGILTAFWGIGILLMLIAVLDYAFFTKPETRLFPSRY